MTWPVSVIIPTLNVGASIESHVASLNQWVSKVREIVVVDSESSDGTMDLLREKLVHPEIRWLTRPKGLYAAWNAAVEVANSEFVYFATVGDELKPDGIEKLHRVACDFDADVVLSPPGILRPNGEPVSNPDWPIHYLIETLAINEPLLLNPIQSFALANAFGIQGLLGSSASNLYRAEVLKRFPFPTQFGHAGDTAWGCENALRVRVAVLPVVCADFIQERDGGILADLECAELELKFLILAEHSISSAITAGWISNPDSLALQLLIQGWYRSRHWMVEQVRHATHVKAVSEERMKYIGDLQVDGADRLKLIESQSAELARLENCLKSATPPGDSVWARIRRRFF